MSKRVLITGAAGFIGSHLAEGCVAAGWSVRAFVRYNSANRWGWLDYSDAKSDIEVVIGDVRDYDAVHRAATGCDEIYHLAALIGIPYSYVSPLAYVRTNVEGTYNILEAARNLGTGNVLVTSTSETYGTAQYAPIDEKHPAVGQSPYAATKVGADQLALSYFLSFGLPVRIVRPFNTYGPRQSARAIIPTIITQILNGQKVLKIGNVTPTRDLTFVKDTAAGFRAIAAAPGLIGQATNIGMNEEISIGDLVHLIAELMGTQVEIHTEAQRLRPQNSEVMRLRCNNEKLLRETAWKPDYTLRRGLLETIAWLQKNAHFYKSELYNV